MPQPKRHQLAIIADPLAGSEELFWLKTQDPLAALNHPNCPPELWWELAVHHPLEALQSLLFPVFVLEAPARWKQLEVSHLEHWIRRSCERLSKEAQHLFAADCAERVLRLFEIQHPNNQGPREALRIRRLLAHHRATEAQWLTARNASRMSSPAGFINISATGAWFAARDASDAATALEAHDAAESAASAVALNTKDVNLPSRGLKQLAHAERKWQWARLQQYLAAETG